MPRASRRDALLEAALSLFVERGYDGTSVADIAGAVGVTKAAVSYHFPAKDDLLSALAEPVLSPLEQLVAEVPAGALGGTDRRRFLERYVDHLVAHADVATWLDTDRGVLTHAVLGARLVALHAATRRLLGGGDGSAGDLAAASALGAMWRPLRTVDSAQAGDRATFVAVAEAALDAARP